MSLPWLQVAVDVFEKSIELGARLDVEEDKALAMLLRLWRFVVASAPKDGPPTGLIPRAKAEAIVAAACRWQGDRGLLLGALIDLGFLELKEHNYRVRGTSRYEPIWKKNRTKPGQTGERAALTPEPEEVPHGNRAEAGGKPGGNREVPERKPPAFRPQDEDEYRDKETTQKPSSPAREAEKPTALKTDDAPARPSGQRPALSVQRPGAVPDHVFAAAVAFFAWSQEERCRAFRQAVAQPQRPEFVPWYAERVATSGLTDERLREAFGDYLSAPLARKNTKGETRKPLAPMEVFMANWDKYVDDRDEDDEVGVLHPSVRCEAPDCLETATAGVMGRRVCYAARHLDDWEKYAFSLGYGKPRPEGLGWVASEAHWRDWLESVAPVQAEAGA
jgi:hypothetical protein